MKQLPSIQSRPIRRARPASWWLVLAVVGTTEWCGCSTRQATAPTASRASGEPEVALVYLPSAPSGASDLGPIQARCERIEPESVSSRERVSLAQLDCSVSLLRRVLEEQAMMRGATALVGAVCLEHPSDASLECEARASRLPSYAWGALGAGGVIAATELPAVATVFRTDVRFVPGGGLGHSRPLGAGAQEASRQLVAERSLGMLQVTALAPTSRDEAIKCIELAAKHFHAAHFGSPSCIAEAHTGDWSCSSELFAPELDERTIAKLR